MRTAASCRIGIAEVEPERAVIAQDAANLAEHVHHARDVLVRRRFEADLPIFAVVAQPPIRRRRHACLNQSIRQVAQSIDDIAEPYADITIVNS